VRGPWLSSNRLLPLRASGGSRGLGLQADTSRAAGGPGKNTQEPSILSFFRKFAYFTEASINSPINFIDVFPVGDRSAI